MSEDVGGNGRGRRAEEAGRIDEVARDDIVDALAAAVTARKAEGRYQALPKGSALDPIHHASADTKLRSEIGVAGAGA